MELAFELVTSDIQAGLFLSVYGWDGHRVLYLIYMWSIYLQTWHSCTLGQSLSPNHKNFDDVIKQFRVAVEVIIGADKSILGL